MDGYIELVDNTWHAGNIRNPMFHFLLKLSIQKGLLSSGTKGELV